MPQTIADTGLPGMPSMRIGPELPMHHRLAGAHRDAPEVQRHAVPHQRGLDKVMIANRRAADRHENIGARVSGSAEGVFECRQTIPRDAEVDDASALGLDDRGEGKIVRGDDLVRADRAPPA